MEQCPKARANGLDLAGRRAEELVHRLHAMATEPVERRIAHVLLQPAALAGHTAEQGTQIGFSLSRQDVAEIVGTDLYVVSRVLRRWADQWLLTAGRLRIAALDPKRIEQIASGVPDAM